MGRIPPRANPSTANHLQANPSTGNRPPANRNTGSPLLVSPSTANHLLVSPSTGNLLPASPSTGNPSTASPSTGNPNTARPSTGNHSRVRFPPAARRLPASSVPHPVIRPHRPPGAPGTPFSVGESFSWAWSQFKANPGPMVLPGVIMAAVGLLFWALIFWGASWVETTATNTVDSYGGTTYTYETTTVNGGALAGLIAVYIVGLLLLLYFQVSILSGAVRVANGEPIDAKSFLVPLRFWPVVGTAILVALIAFVLSFCVIGGIIAAFFLQFAVLSTISESRSPGDAIGRSFRVTSDNIGDSILTLIIVWFTNVVGALLCGIGLIVSAPLAALFQVHAFRRIVGEPVAPPAA